MSSYINLPLTAAQTTLLQYLLSSQISVIRHVEFDYGELSKEDITMCKLCEHLLNEITYQENQVFEDKVDEIENKLEQETEVND